MSNHTAKSINGIMSAVDYDKKVKKFARMASIRRHHVYLYFLASFRCICESILQKQLVKRFTCGSFRTLESRLVIAQSFSKSSQFGVNQLFALMSNSFLQLRFRAGRPSLSSENSSCFVLQCTAKPKSLLLSWHRVLYASFFTTFCGVYMFAKRQLITHNVLHPKSKSKITCVAVSILVTTFASTFHSLPEKNARLDRLQFILLSFCRLHFNPNA